MIYKKLIILLFITSAFCQGKKAKILSILHLGEVKDEYDESNYSIPNYYISKAVHNLMETKEMENYDIQLTPFYFDPESDDEENELGQICKTIADLNNGSLTQDLIIDTTRNPELRQIAAKIASNYRIPVVFVRSINAPDNGEDFSMHLIKFSPPNHDLHVLVEEIILSKKIKDVAVLYDRLVEFPWKELRAELNFLNIPCVFIASRVLIDDIQKQLETVNNMYFKNVFILGKWPAYKKYLTRGQNVYVIHQNIHERNETDANFLQVDVFPRIFNRVNLKEVIGEEPRALEAAFYYELAYASVQSLRRMKESSVDAEEHSDCSSPGNKKYPNYLKYLKKFKEPIFDHSQTRSANENLLSFDIVYKGLTVGHWSSKHKVHITQNNVWEGIQPRRHYKVLAKVKHPFVYSSNGTHWGYLIDLLAMIASVQNFTYDLTVLPDTQAYTSQIFINKIRGVSFDIGLGPVYETRYSDHVSFSIPYYKMVGIKFVMKNTKDDSIFTFITVLEPIVWTCILSAFFINSFLLWASERFSPYSYRNNKEKYAEDEEVRDFTAKESLWFCLTSITPEGGGIVPKHISGRLIVVTWWLFGFIILASYTANLAAFLTLSKMKNPIQNFDDLYRQFKMRYAPLEGSDELEYFYKLLHIENDNREKIFSKKEYPMPRQYDRMIKIINKLQPLNNTDSALEMVYESKSATEGFAFIVDSADARYLLMTRCKLIDVEEEEAKRNLVIVTPNINTILKYDIDNALAIIQRMQWYRDLEKKWWDNNPYKSTNCTELEDDDEGIGIYNIGGVFIMIFVGIGMSMITMAYDYVRYKYRTEGKNKPATLEEEVISVTSASSAQRTAIAPSESTIPEVNDDDKGTTKSQRRNVNKF